MRQLSIQITIYKSKPVKVNVRPSTRSLGSYRTQKAIKGPNITSVKPFKREYGYLKENKKRQT